MTEPAHVLTAADLQLVGRVAVRRCGPAASSSPTRAAMDRVLTAVADVKPFGRAAGLAAAVVADGSFGSAGLVAALLALTVQLRLDGYQLTAPQGVLAGMVRGLSTGRADVDTVARWLEDRAIFVGDQETSPR